MKVFFDIAYLSESLPFDGRELQEAFEKTFNRRSAVQQNCEAVFGLDFAQNSGLASLWKGFLARNDLQNAGDFPSVMEKIKLFLKPIVAGTCDNKRWNHKEHVWGPESRLSQKSDLL